MQWALVTGVPGEAEKEPPTIPETISLVKLMYYDKDRRQDILAASMYFNTMSSKSQNDSYLDRLVQAKAMVKLYESSLDENRKTVSIATGKKKVKEGDLSIAEVVTWLGVNAELLSDGDQFGSSKVTVGVLVRVACLVSDDVLGWFQHFRDSTDKRLRDMVNAVCQQRYMSMADIWLTNGKPRPVRFVFLLPFCVCCLHDPNKHNNTGLESQAVLGTRDALQGLGKGPVKQEPYTYEGC